MNNTVIENHARYLERVNLYKRFGFDTVKEKKIVIEKAKPLFGNILEVGTGKGYLTVALAKKRYHFTSIDISKEEQEFARLNIKYFGLTDHVDFKIENAENLSFENGHFDIIFSVNVIHHLDNPFKVMDELTRVVSPKGKIILSDFSREGFEIVDKVHMSESRKHTVSKNTLSDVENYLAAKNYNIEKHRSIFQEILIAYH